ncbi:MAG: hypothetical protein IJI66_06940 [Erysipelotrichaceae bacterium]|nr:hypothetical protein [Erysipelotrichaceae bacterium]
MNDIIRDIQDLTFLSWSKVRNSSGTAGSFLKAYEETDEGNLYYKLSNYDPYHGITGHECVNEIIADRLLNLLGLEHLSYQLIHAKVNVDHKELITWLCLSRDFKMKNEDKIALDAFYQIMHQEEETPLNFCIRMGWEKEIYEMLVFDFLTLNRDRHGANIEILRNRNNKEYRMAPLFDHGLSLLFNCDDDNLLSETNVMEDKRVQCFVGSSSAKNNLGLIPLNKQPKLNPITPESKNYLLDGLDGIISKLLQERIWDMIYQRWQYYESLFDKERQHK